MSPPPLQLLGKYKPVRPTEPVFPEPIDYPVLDGTGKVVGAVSDWSVGIFGCFGMHNAGFNCCCANCCCCEFRTWGNAYRYAGIDPGDAEWLAALANVDYGDSQLANAGEMVTEGFAAKKGDEKRRKLAAALGLRREGDKAIQRYFCRGCMQCQEVDTVAVFYRDSLGYKDLEYGPCFPSCNCTRFYSNGQVIPYPQEKVTGEAFSPYYPKALGNGMVFVNGEPTPRPQKMQRVPVVPAVPIPQLDPRVPVAPVQPVAPVPPQPYPPQPYPYPYPYPPQPYQQQRGLLPTCAVM